MNLSRLLRASVVFIACALSPVIVPAADDYKPGPDSQPQPGVPKGDLLKFTLDDSRIFPGTTRDYSVYAPAQYHPDKPVCVYIGQDGVQYNAPVVFDNLIAKKEMPVTIGVFIMHGRVKALGEGALDRFNRSFEYDGLGDAYARFVLEEILPRVEKIVLPDGRAIRLPKSGNDYAIGGASSGAICAFTAAWERPDAFRRVFSAVGTYVGLRGGDRYPTLIRKFEPKPLRVFLQDGCNDLNIYGGDWWMANQTMERALAFAGYEVNHAWGEGGHNGKHAGAIFPNAMRWLWKDWPAEVKTGVSSNSTLQAILVPGESWQVAAEGFKSTTGPTANAKGEVFFNGPPAAAPTSQLQKIALDGKISVIAADSKRGDGQAFGPDGRLYAVASGTDQILAYDAGGKPTVIADGFNGNDLIVRHDGLIYATESGSEAKPSRIWLVKPTGEKRVVDTGLKFANGITFSPDQSLLYVDDYRSHWVYSYQIAPDGSLKFKQRYFWLHSPDTADDSSADGMTVDREGRLYVTTRMGIQVCDQAGRVNAILPTPNGRVSAVCFGGADFDTLFAACGDKVFKRKLKVKGAPLWAAPVKPGKPRL